MNALHPAAAPGPRLVSVDGRTYPLESATVTARAEGGIAATTLSQRFLNPHDEPLEVLYTLPLPADGAVLTYTIRMGDRLIRGEVQPRERASQAYLEALYEGRMAGLLEQDRADTFQQRLGNLPPRTPVEVQIEVLQPLRFLAALEDRAPRWEYRFPTVTGIRYEGAPGQVRDADRLDVARGGVGEIPARIEIEIEIASPGDVELRPESASHDIVTEAFPSGSRVRLAHRARLDRDIVLSWNACSPEVGVQLIEGRGLAGDDGRYAVITVVPPELPARSFHRDLTVLVDASGSMEGRPLELAKRVVSDLVRSLGSEDRFELIAFANKPTKLTQGLERADAGSTRNALRRLQDLSASGGTEMLGAIEEALAPLRDDAQRQIVLVTDGQIGFESEVVGHLMRRLPSGSRVHAVGIGAAPNRALLCGVAGAGRGLELHAADDDAAVEAARRLIGGTARPVITELTLAGSAVIDRAPGRPRDVFAGQPALLTIELDARGGTLELSGQMPGTSDSWTWAVTVPAGEESARPISPLPLGALYGRERLADLDLTRSLRHEPARLDAEIEACGMRHRIVSSRTSLVAIAEDVTADPNAPRRRERLAVEMPDGVSVEGSGLMRGAEVYGNIAGFSAMRIDMMRVAPPASRREAPRYLREARAPLEIPATIVRVDGDLLTVEFEVPAAGLELPRRDAMLMTDDGSRHAAEVIAERSSPVGPHAAGLRVKLTVRFGKDVALAGGFAIMYVAGGQMVVLRAAASREPT